MTQHLSGLKISRKLLLAPGIAIFFLVICGVVSCLGLMQQKSAIKDIYTNRFKGYESQASILLNLSSAHTGFHKVINMLHAEYQKDKIEAFAGTQLAAVNSLSGALEKRLASQGLSAEERSGLEKTRALLAEYGKMARDMADIATTDTSIAVTYMDSLDEKFAVLHASLSDLLKLQRDSGSKKVRFCLEKLQFDPCRRTRSCCRCGGAFPLCKLLHVPRDYRPHNAYHLYPSGNRDGKSCSGDTGCRQG